MAEPLYALALDYQRALEALEELDDDEARRDTLASLAGPLEQKAAAVGAYLLNLEAHETMVQEAADKLRERALRLHKRAESLRGYLKGCMEAAQITKIEALDKTFALIIRKNPPSVVIDDFASLPPDCVRIVPQRFEPDKTRIKEALKAGEVPGAHLEAGTRLDIKV